MSVVWDAALATDLATTVPAYVFPGVHDYTCSYSPAKDYFARLQVPVRGFYTFARSAHSPNVEDPEKVLLILREDVLAGTNRLADAP